MRLFFILIFSVTWIAFANANQELDNLLKDLASGSERARLAAAQEVGYFELGDTEVQKIMTTIKDLLAVSDIHQREAAVIALTSLLKSKKHPEALSLLLERLKTDPQTNVRFTAAKGLFTIVNELYDPEITKALTERLYNESDSYLREVIINVLGLIAQQGHRNGIYEALVVALHGDNDKRVRIAAINMLRTLKSQDMPETIQREIAAYQNDKSELIRKAAQDFVK